MGWGQYSANSRRLTKSDMIAHFAQHYSIPEGKARKGGHNRLDFTDTEGVRRFGLYETVVAELSADRRTLMLSDGGWHSPTTKSAWGDACAAFSIAAGYHQPEKHERSVAYALEPVPADAKPDPWGRKFTLRITGRAVETVAPDYLIRADTDHGNLAVRFTGREIVSDAGVRVRCSPFKALVVLYRIDELARRTRIYSSFRGQALDMFGFTAFGFNICPGQTSKVTMIGCHTFKTDAIRSEMRRLAGAHPKEAKAARAFVKRNPCDFGIAAYEACRPGRRIAA